MINVRHIVQTYLNNVKQGKATSASLEMALSTYNKARNTAWSRASSGYTRARHAAVFLKAQIVLVSAWERYQQQAA